MAARTSKIHQRINAITRPAKNHFTGSLFSLCLIVALCVFGLTDAATTAEDPAAVEDPAVATKSDDDVMAQRIAKLRETPNWQFIDEAFIERVEKRKDDCQGKPLRMRGVVKDEQGEPVSGALVVLRLDSAVSVYPRGFSFSSTIRDTFAIRWTDSQGRYEFSGQRFPWSEPMYGTDWYWHVFAPGFAMSSKEYRRFPDDPITENVTLQPAQIIEGVITDLEGEPIENFQCAHAETLSPDGQKFIEVSLLFSELSYFVSTDSRGRFKLGGLPPDRLVSLQTDHATVEWGDGFNPLVVATVDPFDASGHQRRYNKEKPVDASFVGPSFVHKLKRPTDEILKKDFNDFRIEKVESRESTRVVNVKVVDAITGKGVSNIGVGSGSRQKKERYNAYPGMTVTDENGVSRIEIPTKESDVYIAGRRFGYLTHCRRLTADRSEYTPEIETSQWVQTLPAGEKAESLTFKVQPVAPLVINVRDADGNPVQAELSIAARGWSIPPLLKIQTNAAGIAKAPVRPVHFDIEVFAKNKNGRIVEKTFELSKDYQREERVTVVFD